MSRFFSCSSLFGRLASCRYQPVQQNQQHQLSEPQQRTQHNEHGQRQGQGTRAGGGGVDAPEAAASLLSGWRLWLACGAASLVPLTDFWSERLQQRRRLWWGGGGGGLLSTGLTQCMLESAVVRRPVQQQQQQQPLEEVARSLTARSIEQACRLCTSRAVAEARAGRPDRARAMWLSAASFSYPPALFNLGLLAAGSGSSGEAAAYYRAAADLGHPAAAFNLACMLLQRQAEASDGEDGEDADERPQSLAVAADLQQSAASESRRWLSRAADSGLAEALLLEAEQLLDESRHSEAEQRLRRLLASQAAPPSAVAAAELLLRRCLSRQTSDVGAVGDCCGLKRCSRSSPDFASSLAAPGRLDLSAASLQAKEHFYPSFYSRCKQLHKY